MKNKSTENNLRHIWNNDIGLQYGKTKHHSLGGIKDFDYFEEHLEELESIEREKKWNDIKFALWRDK